LACLIFSCCPLERLLLICNCDVYVNTRQPQIVTQVNILIRMAIIQICLIHVIHL
jgi:hypothetical protein